MAVVETNPNKNPISRFFLGSHKPDVWTWIALGIFALFLIFLVYPMWGVLRNSVVGPDGFTLDNFAKFFEKSYYFGTIKNSVVVSLAVTGVSLLIGIPFSYFYTYYKIRGAKMLFIGAILSAMSAPFIGAYAWILLMGRKGVLTEFLESVLPIQVGSIYGFGGILLVLSLKLFPLVSVFMNGAFRSIDASLIEAASLMGSTRLKRFFQISIMLSMPTILAAALLVFMRAFADFGTPLLIGEGYRTFTVEIYNQYLGEVGQNHNFAAAIAVIAIIVTALVFLLQKWATGKFKFTLQSSRQIEKKRPKGIGGFFIYLYCYVLVALAFLPQLYIVYLSFRKSSQVMFLPGYSLDNYRLAADRLLGRSIVNTLVLGGIALAIIILISILLAYLVVRRSSVFHTVIDTLSMAPYIMPGAVIGIALVVAFNRKPLALTGTIAILVIALVIRRMPYTIRSATATLMHIPVSIEEAARSLGASKMKTFFRITTPMMSAGIVSGALLSFVAIVTEMSSAIILYNNKTITLTMSAYVAISRGNYGLATAFSAILTVLTGVIVAIYLMITKEEDVKV